MQCAVWLLSNRNSSLISGLTTYVREWSTFEGINRLTRWRTHASQLEGLVDDHRRFLAALRRLVWS